MATVAVLSSTQISTNHYRSYGYKLSTPTPVIRRTWSFDRISLVQANSSKREVVEEEEETRASNGKPPSISQEDLNYVVKLGGGSVVGAAVIKYGSILFPEMTRPNIGEAMIMISAPVLLAVLLLIIQSRTTRRN